MSAITINQDVCHQIAAMGFAWVPHAAWSTTGEADAHWRSLSRDWDHLEPDRYLDHSASFRRRRYGRYYWLPDCDLLVGLPHDFYFQPIDENAYAGGIVRNFAPISPETVNNSFLSALVRCTFACLPLSPGKRRETWEVRIHQIRIVATPDAPGFPAPEGIHRDGTDFLTLHLMGRKNVVGGESTIYDLDRSPIQSFTMLEALDSLILDDQRVMHGVTPVHSADGRAIGTRDLLGLDFIHNPLLEPPASLK
jgi:hypothetical protein